MSHTTRRRETYLSYCQKRLSKSLFLSSILFFLYFFDWNDFFNYGKIFKAIVGRNLMSPPVPSDCKPTDFIKGVLCDLNQFISALRIWYQINGISTRLSDNLGHLIRKSELTPSDRIRRASLIVTVSVFHDNWPHRFSSMSVPSS